MGGKKKEKLSEAKGNCIVLKECTLRVFNRVLQI